MFAQSTSGGWPRAHSISDMGSALSHHRLVSRFFFCFTCHKLTKSFMLFRASAFAYLGCWASIWSCWFVQHQPQDTNNLFFFRGTLGSSAEPFNEHADGHGCPDTSDVDECSAQPVSYAWGFISAWGARLAWVLATWLAGEPICPPQMTRLGLGPVLVWLWRQDATCVRRDFVRARSRATDEGAPLDVKTSQLFAMHDIIGQAAHPWPNRVTSSNFLRTDRYSPSCSPSAGGRSDLERLEFSRFASQGGVSVQGAPRWIAGLVRTWSLCWGSRKRLLPCRRSPRSPLPRWDLLMNACPSSCS